MSNKLNGSGSYRRIVVKLGTSLLTYGSKHRLNKEVIADLVRQMSRLRARGMEMILVTSGAVAAGRHILRITDDEPNLPERQVLAAAGQPYLMEVYHEIFDRYDMPVAQALISRKDLDGGMASLNLRNTLLGLIDNKIVPIINENDVVSVEELDQIFGDNDTLAGTLSRVMDADLLIILGTVAGLHTSDPNDPESHAELIPVVDCTSEDYAAAAGPSWDKQGRGGMAAKVKAACETAGFGIKVVIAGGVNEDDVLLRIVDDEAIGTVFTPVGSKQGSNGWMRNNLKRGRKIFLDDGAVNAICLHNRSLLPAGIKEVQGTFGRGDVVYLANPRGDYVAYGMTNYGYEDLIKIKGQRTGRIPEILGRHYGDEAVHRNHMVILRNGKDD